MTYCYSKGLEHNVYNMKFLFWENVGNCVVGTLKMTRRTKCWFCSAPCPAPTRTARSGSVVSNKPIGTEGETLFQGSPCRGFVRDSLFVPLDKLAFIPKWAHEILAPNLCSEPSFGEAVDLIRQCPVYCLSFTGPLKCPRPQLDVISERPWDLLTAVQTGRDPWLGQDWHPGLLILGSGLSFLP